ncbi:MAG: glycosyltransferase [Pirellula sp.]
MPSIIIPAYNEAAVIGRTLNCLLNQKTNDEVDIIVACNGCNDNTAEIAKRSPGVRVLETNAAGKSIALNMGDDAATKFPRIYLDADIEVSETFISDMKKSLDNDLICVAWPQVRFDLTDASPSVQAFYEVWSNLPYHIPGKIGVGAYALNQRGRSAFDRFPHIIADDGFIRGLFPQKEQRAVVDTCHTIVKVPSDLKSLIAIKTRSRMGLYELNKCYPAIHKGHADEKTQNR